MKRFLVLGFVLGMGAGLQASTDWSAYVELAQDFDKNASQVKLKLEQASVDATNDLVNAAIVELLSNKLGFAYQDLINANFEHKERFLRERIDQASSKQADLSLPEPVGASIPVVSAQAVPDKAMSKNLYQAVASNNIAQVKALLAQGANARMLDEQGKETLLHKAVARSFYNTDIVTTLLENGADINAVDNMGQTPLHVAAWQGVTDDMVKVLLDAGANVDALNSVGQSPMDIATNTDNNEMVSLMVPKQGPKNKASQPGYFARLYNYFTSK